MVKSLKRLAGIMLAKRRRRWPSITSVGPMYRVIWCFWRRDGKRLRIMQQSENTVQSPNAVSKTGQRRRVWFNSETALGECHVFAQYTADTVLVLGQRRRRLTGFKPAMGCDSGPTLNWDLLGIVGLHSLYEVHRRQLVLNECWPAPAMVVWRNTREYI